MFPVSLRLLLAHASLGLLPVLIFLFSLELIDTYKLFTLPRVLRSVAVGALVAVACYGLNTAVAMSGAVSAPVWARSGAPLVEEVAKALYVGWLLRKNRLGFMVDAAISGFAVGAGFAVLENLTYIVDMTAAGLLTSAVRGLGTAMMHGATTAIFGIVSVNLNEMRESRSPLLLLPGLSVAVLIHELYNQPVWNPVKAAVAVLIVLPVLMSFIFWRSEKALERWLGTKLDKDIDLLQTLSGGEFSSSRAGRYLKSLEGTFAPEVLGDMLSYLQLSLELSARAKGDLLRREMDFPVAPDPELPAQIKELRYLESQIGRAGRLAVAPLLGQSRRDLWEMERLAAGEGSDA